MCNRPTLGAFDKRGMRIGIIREGKTPPDQRVPLTPEQCAAALERFPYVELVVQPSDVRRITDDEYRAAGIELAEDLSDCDVLFGVKEVPIDQLIPDYDEMAPFKTDTFTTRFDRDQAEEDHESQVTIGSSGGAAFIKNGADWELAGILHSQEVFNDQPDQDTGGNLNSSIYGNETLAADLAGDLDRCVEGDDRYPVLAGESQDRVVESEVVAPASEVLRLIQ